MGMLIASVLLLIISALFYISTKKNADNLILSVALFVASVGCFGSYMEVSLLPNFIIQIEPNSNVILFMRYLSSFFLSMGHYFPYSILLIFSIYFSGYMEDKKKIEHIYTVMIICIPSIVCFILFPVGKQFEPDFKFLSIWCGIYFIISILILSSTYKRALTKSEKNNRLFVSMAVIPSAFLHYIFVNVTQAFGNKTIWQYSYIIVAAAFVVYLFFIIRFGAFGLKIRFEKLKMDTAIRTINTSTVIFNHAVKNEVSKISMCASTIKSFQDRIECPEMREKISLSTEIIEDSSSHLLNLVSRIKENSKPIVLNEDTMSLQALIDHVVKVYSRINNSKNVQFHIISDYCYIIRADYAHLRECFCNIICNAIEAADTDIEITVRVIHQGRFLVVIVTDNGPGISNEHIPYLLEPFYSTKKNDSNFGLGLFYCNNVIRKHEGALEISSLKGKGTKVTLTIPEKRIIRKQPIMKA